MLPSAFHFQLLVFGPFHYLFQIHLLLVKVAHILLKELARIPYLELQVHWFLANELLFPPKQIVILQFRDFWPPQCQSG